MIHAVQDCSPLTVIYNKGPPCYKIRLFQFWTRNPVITTAFYDYCVLPKACCQGKVTVQTLSSCNQVVGLGPRDSVSVPVSRPLDTPHCCTSCRSVHKSRYLPQNNNHLSQTEQCKNYIYKVTYKETLTHLNTSEKRNPKSQTLAEVFKVVVLTHNFTILLLKKTKLQTLFFVINLNKNHHQYVLLEPQITSIEINTNLSKALKRNLCLLNQLLDTRWVILKIRYGWVYLYVLDSSKSYWMDFNI